MPLFSHLRELRQRITKALLAILVGTILGWIFYEPFLELLQRPYEKGIAPLLREQGLEATLAITGIGGAFQFQLKISLIVGLIASSPVWLWQIWAFVLPALHRHERKWALLLTGTGAPLFVGGAVVGYLVLPKAIEVLIGFVPDGWESLLTAGDYLNFVLRMMLVFGVSAQIPLVVVLLNRLRIVSAKQLARARPWTIVGIFIFAAVATPSTDPLTMLFLAIPMCVLYLISEVIARLTDRKRAVEAAQGPADDELSPLD